ncbi:GNAT family N-acetyltransferase [Pleomorphomonas sp. NRK KF1]|uniref:GNAT family N-acetyltransferase n=1 Tax=Pleomorphomonas sp. NRK KF1 TaxID=2943000 RepID=UPI002042E29C|nr:GNAT family N-acetyltransferase [Pleomorphomonas sp. NRK KF1]MCM5551671.1 GNAT family N-acetyltransferase [Pleomorphomonas sp. NRK KF1]
MSISIRPFNPGDAEVFLRVHHAAVRGIAANDYSASIINAWAPVIQAAHIEHVKADLTGERILALSDGEVAGVGEVAPELSELRACYVVPGFARKGIGRQIVAELEQIARSRGVLRLWVDSSLTAEAFYMRLGYSVRQRGEHILGNGIAMACVTMEKTLQ